MGLLTDLVTRASEVPEGPQLDARGRPVDWTWCGGTDEDWLLVRWMGGYYASLWLLYGLAWLVWWR